MTSSVLDSKLVDLVKDQKLITLDPFNTVSSALEKLSQNHILCAPVVETAGTKKPVLIGFVDVLDLLAFMVKQCTKNLFDTITGESTSLTTDDIAMMKKRAKDFTIAHVTDVINLSKRDPSYAMKMNSTLRDAINSYLKGVHRIAVIDDDGALVGIVSQCGVFEKILQRKDELLKQMAEVKVKDSPFVTHNVVCVNKDELTFQAMMKMYQKNLGDVGILDNNRLIGVFSASDLKYMVEPDFSKLLLPIHKFVGNVRQSQGKKEDFIVAATPDEDIATVMRKMVENRVHRVFIVENLNNMKPVGVVSMTDIMRGSIKGAPSTA